VTGAVATPAVRPVALIVVPEMAPVRRRTARARRAVVAFAVSFVAFTVGLSLLIDGPWDWARDPEYAARRDRLVARVREHPRRPVVLVLGSSRSVEGVRPDVVNAPTGPMLLNGGLIGSGSMLELLAYRRLKADGVRPAAVLIEYWPVLLRGDLHAEYGRIDPKRLRLREATFVNDYFAHPQHALPVIWGNNLWPAVRYRRALLAAVKPKWVPDARHDTRFAGGIDAWGWWPGVRDDDAETVRAERADVGENPFRVYLDGFSIGTEADRALRDLLNECRADGVAAALIILPESLAFRTLYAPEAETNWRTHLAGIVKDFGVPVLNAREWDKFGPDLPDHVHLTRGGAERFSLRLMAELPRLFPGTYGGRILTE
jgi:hypothetical protein